MASSSLDQAEANVATPAGPAVGQVVRAVSVWWLVGLSATLCWLPIAVGPVLPMGDAPAHLALARIFHGLLHGPDPDFTVGTLVSPNIATVLLLQPLLTVLPMLTAFKLLLLVGYFGAAGVAAGIVFARLGRSQHFGALLPPLLLGQQLLNGFVDFMAAVPFLLGVVAVLLRPERSWRGLWWLPVAGFFIHIQAWLLASVWLGWVALGDDAAGNSVVGRMAHRLGNALATTLPGAAVAGWWYWTALRGGAGTAEIRWGPALDVRLAELVPQSLLVLPTRQDDAVVVAWLLAAMWATGGSGRAATPRPLRAVVATTALLYAVLPDGIGAYVELYHRTGTVLLLLLPFVALGGSTPTAGALRWHRVAILLLPALVAGWAWQDRMTEFNRSAAGLRTVLACARPGSTLFFAPSSTGAVPGFERFLFRHAAQYHVAEQNGRTSFSFAWIPGRIVAQHRPGFDFEYAGPNLWQQTERLGRYDFALRFDLAPQPPINGFEPKCASGPWSLWARRPGANAAPDTPPT